LIVDDTFGSYSRRITATSRRIGGGRSDSLFPSGISVELDNIERIELNLGYMADSVTIVPAAATEFVIRGNEPSGGDLLTSDYLELRLAGTRGRTFVAGSSPDSGTWTFTNRAPVSFEGIEDTSP
jgi:hypothetical protein